MRKIISISFFLCFLLVFSCKKTEENKPKEETVETVKDSIVSKEVKEEQIVPQIVFTVQIGAFKNKNNGFSSLKNAKVTQHQSLYKYRLKSFQNYRDARNYRKTILKQYPGAFVQALKDGQPISIKEAL